MPQETLRLPVVFPSVSQDTPMVDFERIYGQLDGYGLKPKIIGEWMNTHKEKKRIKMVRKNWKRLLALESENPGIARVLYDEFGISNFARYPKEILIKQYAERNSKKRRAYIAIISAKGDRDGALYRDVGIFRKLFRQTKKQYRLLVWEVGNERDLIRVLNVSRKRYGKIALGFVNGHGDKLSIVLGKTNGYREELTKKDLEQRGPRAVRRAFIKNPIIILNSCKAGLPKGIASYISEMLGAKVFAAKGRAWIGNIDVRISPQGKLKVAVEFKDAKGQVSTVVYKSMI